MYRIAVPCSLFGCILRGFVFVLEVFKKFVIEFNQKVVTSRIRCMFLVGGFTFIGGNTLIEGLFCNICVEELDAGMQFLLGLEPKTS